MQFLTRDQHDFTMHLCGRTGHWLEKNKHVTCRGCIHKINCNGFHGIMGMDAEIRYEGLVRLRCSEAHNN